MLYASAQRAVAREISYLFSVQAAASREKRDSEVLGTLSKKQGARRRLGVVICGGESPSPSLRTARNQYRSQVLFYCCPHQEAALNFHMQETHHTSNQRKGGHLADAFFKSDLLVPLGMQVDHWIDFSTTLAPGNGLAAACTALNEFLSLRTFLAGHQLTAADVACWAQLSSTNYLTFCHVYKSVCCMPFGSGFLPHECIYHRSLTPYKHAMSKGQTMDPTCLSRVISSVQIVPCVRLPSNSPPAILHVDMCMPMLGADALHCNLVYASAGIAEIDKS